MTITNSITTNKTDNCNEEPQLPVKIKTKFSRARYAEILDRLSVKYPTIFSALNPKILKIGIYRDIIDDGFVIKRKELGCFLARYTRRPSMKVRAFCRHVVNILIHMYRIKEINLN